MRLFVAIKLPQKVTDLLAGIEKDLDRGFDGVKWVRPEAVHLTLKFLGTVEESRLDEVKEALGRAAEGLGVFRISTTGLGGFPGLARPRVVWLGIKENEHLGELQARIERELGAIGFEAESRPFRPHLTLCRIKRPASGRALGALVNEISKKRGPRMDVTFVVNGFILYRSKLSPRGAEYSEIEVFPLKKGTG